MASVCIRKRAGWSDAEGRAVCLNTRVKGGARESGHRVNKAARLFSSACVSSLLHKVPFDQFSEGCWVLGRKILCLSLEKSLWG